MGNFLNRRKVSLKPVLNFFTVLKIPNFVRLLRRLHPLGDILEGYS